MKFNVITTLVVSLLMFFARLGFGQYLTLQNYTGSWSDPASWDSPGIISPLFEDVVENSIEIKGYITIAEADILAAANDEISFKGGSHQGKSFTITDTLVIEGDIRFKNGSMTLDIPGGGLMVVFGNLTAENKLNISNGGTLVVTGNVTFSNGGQAVYNDEGGSIYVDGDVTGNLDGGSDEFIAAESTTLSNSSDPAELALYSFIAGEGETPLPIRLGYFTGGVHKSEINLEWQTLSEENFDYFEVQRSADGAAFDVIGTVKGNGFTFEPHHYSFTDSQPGIGFNYYRLNAVDFDGSSEVFHVIMIENQPDFSNVRLYPNPGDGLSLRLDVPEILFSHTPLSLVISDLNGKSIFKQEITGQSMLASFQSTLPDGMYIATLTTDRYVHSITIIVH